jgi:lipopolysaccharide export system protein LptA
MACTGFRFTNREPAVLVEAPAALLDVNTFEATSVGPFRLQTPGGAFRLEGVGFRWEHHATRLTLSNSVRTEILSLPVPGAPAPAPGADPAPSGRRREIMSDSAEFDAAARQAVYRGNASVTDADWRLRSASIVATFDAASNRLERAVAEQDVTLETLRGPRTAQVKAAKAVYTAQLDADQIELSGRPVWQSGPYAGQSDRLVLVSRRGQLEFRGAGQSRVTVPRLRGPGGTPDAAPGAAEAAVVVESDTYEMQGNEVRFRGQVRVRDGARRIACGTLAVTLSAERDRVERLEAEQEVRVELTQGGQPLTVSSDTATFESREGAGILRFTGQPRWETADASGQARVLTLVERGPDYLVRAEDDASVRIARSRFGRVDLFTQGRGRPGAAPNASGTPSTALSAAPAAAGAAASGTEAGPIELTCRTYELTPGQVRFEGGVRLDNLPGTLSCETMHGTFDSARSQLKELQAEGGVELRQTGRRLRTGRMILQTSGVAGRLDSLRAEGDVEMELTRGLHLVTAQGDLAVYTEASGIVELTGNPRVRTQSSIQLQGADKLFWHVASNRVSARGAYHVEGSLDSLRTNRALLGAPGSSAPGLAAPTPIASPGRPAPGIRPAPAGRRAPSPVRP